MPMCLATVPFNVGFFPMIEVKTSSMKRGTVLPNFGGKYQLFDCNDFAMEDGEKKRKRENVPFF